MTRRRSDTMSLQYADRPPRLASLREIRWIKSMREELHGEKDRQKIKGVTLPRVKWLERDK